MYTCQFTKFMTNLLYHNSEIFNLKSSSIKICYLKLKVCNCEQTRSNSNNIAVEETLLDRSQRREERSKVEVIEIKKQRKKETNKQRMNEEIGKAFSGTAKSREVFYNEITTS